MLTYKKGCSGIYLLLRIAGTAWPHGILPGLLSAGLGLVLSSVKDVDDLVSNKELFIDNPYPYQLFAYLVGFVLIFRTNFSYLRYWEALDAVQRMGAKWADGACMAVAFDAKGDVWTPHLQPSVDIGGNGLHEAAPAEAEGGLNQGCSHTDFFAEVVNLFSLMHALALQHLRRDPDLLNLAHSSVARMTVFKSSPLISSSKNALSGFASKNASVNSLRLKVLGGLPEEFRCVLEFDNSGAPLHSLARVAMVESWIMRRLIARQKYEPAGDMCKTAPPILSRMAQVISDGNLAFSQAAKVAETPFPFPYHNIIALFLWIFALTAPFVVNAKLLFVPARFAINFMAVWAYFSISEVGDNLEDPFMPYDPNDLPLEVIHHNFNARLLSFGVVPKVAPPASAKLTVSRTLA
mmetsp:Transcript_10897/g.22508  ORF Transcript_10897/g.22508 Transcript_10897/m.22508 type:complete len:407 (-) Transcript_10897:58-1278(-)